MRPALPQREGKACKAQAGNAEQWTSSELVKFLEAVDAELLISLCITFKH